MLQQIRDSATGPFAWIVIAIIAIPFAFFGLETFRSGGSDPTVAKVGDQKITARALQNSYDARYQRLQDMLGENFDPSMIQPAQFRRTVLDEMVREEVVTQHVREAGYRSSDAAVLEYLRSIPAFQADGTFSPQAYRQTLAAQGRDPQRFEAQVGQALAIDQVQRGLADSAVVAPGEIDLAYRLERQTRRFQQIVFSTAAYRDAVEVSEDAVRERYDAQPDRFRTPERVRIAYIELNASQLETEQDPDEAALRELYESEQARFTTPAERKASHILIKTDERSDDAAKEEIDALAEALAQGADFATLASEQSEDAGSASDGGDLGWVQRGMMVPAFEDALYATEAGTVSAPVKTEFGWHLIKVTDVRERTVKPFDDADVQQRLTRMYRRDAANAQFQELSEELEAVAFESVDALEPAAEATGLTLETSQWFTRNGGPGITSNPAVIDAAFSPAVLQDGENSSLIEIEPGRLVVLRAAEHEPSEQRPFEQVADQIRAELVSDAAEERARTDAQAAAERVRAGESLEAVANDLGLDVSDSGLIERDEQQGREGASFSPRTVRSAFGIPRAQAGTPQGVELLTVSGGDTAVMALLEVQDPRVPDAGSERTQLASQLANQQSSAVIAGWEAAVRADTKVRVYDEVISEQAADQSPY